MIDKGERGHPAFQSPSQQTANPGRMNRLVRLNPHDANVRSLTCKLAFKNFRQHRPGSDLRAVYPQLLAGKQAEFFQFAEQVVVAWVAKRFLKTFPNSSLECFGHG